MTAYYNENDKGAAAWLRELIAKGLIADGVVDDRSIVEVVPADLAGFERVHFFAGIGGWDYALQLAGWAGPVWTGSCPCQPFSAAGKRLGAADKRHLWPEFYRLIAECRPAIVFGEQVASKDGREWLAGVRVDLERVAYGVGAADLCAAGEGAPHIRQRLFWMGATNCKGSQPRRSTCPLVGYRSTTVTTGSVVRLADAGRTANQGQTQSSDYGWDAEIDRPPSVLGRHCLPLRRLADASGEQRGRAGQPWQDGVWLPCLDGKTRRIEPSSFPLAHGVSARVGRLRGYGNAIVPQVATEFIAACRDALR